MNHKPQTLNQTTLTLNPKPLNRKTRNPIKPGCAPRFAGKRREHLAGQDHLGSHVNNYDNNNKGTLCLFWQP